MTKSKWVLAGVIAVAVFAGAAAPSALAGGGRRAGKRAAKAAEVVRQKRRSVAEIVASLGITDEQRALVLAKAREAAPIVAGARDEVRRAVARAWASAGSGADRKAVRTSVKAEIQAIRERARGQIEPLAREVVTSLTPEQRRKLEEAVSRRGKTLDDAKLTRFAARLISRPMTVPFLEARAAK